jgi:uncharacterized protein (DUF362 family)
MLVWQENGISTSKYDSKECCMPKPVVAIMPYQTPRESVRKVVACSNGLDHLPRGAKVFIKPNIVFWTTASDFPKWGVITTSRVVEDMVVLLQDHGITDITIGEGMVTGHGDRETPAHAFERLGYNRLGRRYGVKTVDIMARPFEKVDLGDGIELKFNRDILESDFVVNLPVLKTHVQTVVSLGIKNLKGTINLASRKRCHSPDPVRDLHFMVARMSDKMPPMLTLIDGIYSNERGPGMDGRIRRTNVLVASADVLAADVVGAHILGHAPQDVPHLVHAAARRGRSLVLDDINLAGESLASFRLRHEYDHAYTRTADGAWLPTPFARIGMEGLSFRKYDTTMCTYCSRVNGMTLAAIHKAWQGEAWDKVEILTGKRMAPTPGMHKTILIGKCIYRKHRDNPAIEEMIAVKGCPPDPEDILKALRQAGISADEAIFTKADLRPGKLMRRYKDDPAFEETLFQVA